MCCCTRLFPYLHSFFFPPLPVSPSACSRSEFALVIIQEPRSINQLFHSPLAAFSMAISSIHHKQTNGHAAPNPHLLFHLHLGFFYFLFFFFYEPGISVGNNGWPVWTVGVERVTAACAIHHACNANVWRRRRERSAHVTREGGRERFKERTLVSVLNNTRPALLLIA